MHFSVSVWVIVPGRESRDIWSNGQVFFSLTFCLFISLFILECRCCSGLSASAKCSQQTGSCAADTIQFARRKKIPALSTKPSAELAPQYCHPTPTVAPIPAFRNLLKTRTSDWVCVPAFVLLKQ